jgi:ankyrin repeat protein
MSTSRIKAQKRQASVKIVDNEGQTALHLAAKARGNEEVIWLLLMAGATVDMQDGHGHTALRLAARESGENDVGWAEAALEWAVMKHDEIMVQHLLAQDVGATTRYQTVLGWILDQENAEMLLLLLSKKDVDWNTDDGHRALLWAVDTRRIKTVRALAGSGIDKFHLSKALNQAVERPCGSLASTTVEVVKILSEAGADVNAKYDGKTTLYMAVENSSGRWVTSGTVKIIRGLSEAGADVNAKYDGKTALHVAVENSDGRRSTSDIVEIVGALLEAGADVNAKYDGKTALYMADKKQLWSVAVVLEKHMTRVQAVP